MPDIIRCEPIAAMKRHITFEKTVQKSLPRSLWSGSMNLITSQTKAKTANIATTAANGPWVSRFVREVTIAPGPASNGQANGTEPTSTGPRVPLTATERRRVPKIKWSIAMIRSNTPPAICSAGSWMWKMWFKICLPANENITSMVTPTRQAVLNAFRLWPSGTWCVTSRRMGMLPIGSTIANNASIASK